MSKRQKWEIQGKETPVNNKAVRSFLSWVITEMSMKTIIKHHLQTFCQHRSRALHVLQSSELRALPMHSWEEGKLIQPI